MPNSRNDKADAAYLLPPMRPERRIVALPVDTTELPFYGGADADGSPRIGVKSISAEDFQQTLITPIGDYTAGLTDYIYVRLRDRGMEPGRSLIYKFLVNPETVSINRQTVDAESFARGGWNTGVWGDLIDVNLSGKTAGQYFAGVLSDEFAEYSRSYRNLLELQAVYENNGYWFEAEELGNAALASAQTRQNIQLHADVELIYDNFVWKGMFQDLTTEDSADTPFLNTFNLNFIVFKESYRHASPYWSSLPNKVYRGHAYELHPKRSGAKPKGLTDNQREAASGPNASGSFQNVPQVFSDFVQSQSVPSFAPFIR